MSAAKELPAAEGAIKVDSEMDFNALRAKLQKLIDDIYPPDNQLGGWNSIEALTASYVVYCYNGDLFKLSFTLDSQNEPMLGERVKVKRTFAAEGAKVKMYASESFDITEAEKLDDGGMKWRVQVIRSGRTLFPQQPLDAVGMPGRMAYRLYTAEALRQAVTDGCFENLPCVLRTQGEHLKFMQDLNTKGTAPRAVNDEIKRVVGNISAAEAVDVGDGEVAIQGTLTLRKKNKFASQLRDDLLKFKTDAAESLGLSVTCATLTTLEDTDKKNPVLRVWEIPEAYSADPCKKGNAGGYFMDAAEAQSQPNQKRNHNMKLSDRQKAAIAAQILFAAEEIEGGASAEDATKGMPATWEEFAASFIWSNFPNAGSVWESEEELKGMETPKLIKLFVTAQGLKDTKVAVPPVEDKKELPAAESADNKTVLAEVEKLRNEIKVKETSAHVEKALGLTSFNEPMKNHIRNRYTNMAAEASDVDGVIRDFGKLAADMGFGDTFRGNPDMRVNMDEQDKWKRNVMGFFFPALNTSESVNKEAEKILGYNPGKSEYQSWGSLKDMFLSITGRTGNIESFFTNAAEAASTEILAQLSTDALNVHLLAAYRANVQFKSWEKIVRKVTVNDLRNIHAQTYGQFATGLSIPVSKTADYAELDLKGDEEVTYKAIRRGNVFGLSIEDVINDNVSFVQSIAPNLARMAGRDIYKKIWNLINDGWDNDFTGWHPDQVTGEVTARFFHSTWGNTTNVALASDKVVLGRAAMLQYKEIGSGEPMEVVPKYLVHQTRDFDTARQLTTPASGQSNEVATTAQSLGLERIEIPFFNDSTQQRWWLISDPMDFPVIETAFLYGRQEPAIIPEAAGTGKNFSADLMQWKITHFWNAARVNPRAAYGSKVS